MNHSNATFGGIGFGVTTNIPTLSPLSFQKTLSPTVASEIVQDAVTTVLDSHANRSTNNATQFQQAVEILLSQGYIFSPDPYEPSGWAEIWAVVVFSLLIFLVPGMTALVSHVRASNERRANMTNALQALKTLGLMFLRVFQNFFFASRRREVDVERIGVEGASILYFERELGRLLIMMALITNITLVPIHFSFAAKDGLNLLGQGKSARTSDFIPWTISNVPVSSSYSVLWIHIAFIYLLTGVILWFGRYLNKEFQEIETKAKKSSGSDAEAGTAHDSHPRDSCSLFVEGEVNFFPSSEHDLKRAFEIVIPSQVESIRIFEQRTRLRQLGEFRSVVTFKTSQQAKEFLSQRLRKLIIKQRFQEMLQGAAASIESKPEEDEGSEGDEHDVLIARTSADTESSTYKELTFLSAVRMDRWKVTPAPDPEDIIWDALTVERWTFMCRSFCVNVLLVVSLLIFTTPIAFITFASGVTSDQMQSDIHSTYVSVFANLRLFSPALGDFLFAFLPQLLLVICDAWLLFALQLTSKMVEPHHTHSGREVSLFRKSFWFLLFNTLLLPSLALSSISAFLGDLLQNELSPFALLGRAFATSSGAFMLTFIATQTWVGASMDVTRLSERLYFMARGYARPWASAEERRQARLAQFEYDYGTEYAMALTMFSLCVVFSTVAPPILIFGVSYFIVKQATDDHCLRHLVARQEIDKLPRAHVARAVLRYISVSVILLQSSTFGFFATDVCLPSSKDNSNLDTSSMGSPCITNEYSGFLKVRGSFEQILALLVCLIFTCVYAIRDVIKASREAIQMEPSSSPSKFQDSSMDIGRKPDVQNNKSPSARVISE